MDHLGQRTTDGDYGSDAAAEGWSHGAAERAQWLGPVTEMMLDLAGVGPGHRVLDVAAGTGEQTLLAARRVGPTKRPSRCLPKGRASRRSMTHAFYERHVARQPRAPGGWLQNDKNILTNDTDQ